jgi:DNA repair protein RAD16
MTTGTAGMGSPIFSTKTQSGSLDTSDLDNNEDQNGTKLSATAKTRVTRSTLANAFKKRPAECNDDNLDSNEQTFCARTISKRRVVTRRAYVEIKVNNNGDYGISSQVSTYTFSRDGFLRLLQPHKIKKGKTKAVARPLSIDRGAASEDGLDYDALLEESDDSGSEFRISADEIDFAAADDEDLMVDMAIRDSLQTARLDNAETFEASSSKARVSSNPAAALRAAAAEARLICTVLPADADDAAVFQSETEPILSSEEESLSNNRRRKAVKVYDTTSKKSSSIVDMRMAKRKMRQLAVAERRANKMEEAEMMRKLGRKLTMVNYF